MKAQVGQILPPEPKPGVSLPQVAVALTLIGITAAVTVEAQALILAKQSMPGLKLWWRCMVRLLNL